MPERFFFRGKLWRDEHTHTVLRSFPWAILEKPGRNPHNALLPGTLTKNRYFRKRKVKKSEPAHSLWKQSPSGAAARTSPLPALPSSPPRTLSQPRTSQLAQSVSLWLGPRAPGAPSAFAAAAAPRAGRVTRSRGTGSSLPATLPVHRTPLSLGKGGGLKSPLLGLQF